MKMLFQIVTIEAKATLTCHPVAGLVLLERDREKFGERDLLMIEPSESLETVKGNQSMPLIVI